MGAHFSKKISELQYNEDLASYEAACELDAELQNFDNALQTRTTRVIKTLAVGVDVRSLSFDSLKEVTACLLDMNQEVVKIILDCKKDIWKNQELFDLVEDYFKNSLRILDFCTSLENCLRKARDSQLLLHIARHPSDREGEEEKGCKLVKIMQELKSFKEAGDPFTQEFFEMFRYVYREQISMLERLRDRKNKIDKKMKSARTWKKVTNIIFMAAFVTALICSVTVVAVSAPPVVVTLAATASAHIGSMGKWVHSLWKKYEDGIKIANEAISSLQIGNYILIKDLDEIKSLVGTLNLEIQSLLETPELAAIERDSIESVVTDIKTKVEILTKSIEDLNQQVDRCSRDIRRARTVVLQRIIHPPTS